MSGQNLLSSLLDVKSLCTFYVMFTLNNFLYGLRWYRSSLFLFIVIMSDNIATVYVAVWFTQLKSLRNWRTMRWLHLWSNICTHWSIEYKINYKSWHGELIEDGQLKHIYIWEKCLPDLCVQPRRRYVGEAYIAQHEYYFTMWTGIYLWVKIVPSFVVDTHDL